MPARRWTSAIAPALTAEQMQGVTDALAMWNRAADTALGSVTLGGRDPDGASAASVPPLVPLLFQVAAPPFHGLYDRSGGPDLHQRGPDRRRPAAHHHCPRDWARVRPIPREPVGATVPDEQRQPDDRDHSRGRRRAGRDLGPLHGRAGPTSTETETRDRDRDRDQIERSVSDGDRQRARNQCRKLILWGVSTSAPSQGHPWSNT